MSAINRKAQPPRSEPQGCAGRESWSKRALDVILSLAGLLLGAPFAAVAALAIKLEDGGPVFHVQERVGRYGRRFRAWKFRSMVPDADRRYGYVQAAERDGRVTRVGRVLRATAFDEWPQLWNILRGEMSFVGPRPLLPAEVEICSDGRLVPQEEIPGYRERHLVRPGLTGLAQVYAPRDLPRKQKFRLDRLYVRRRSLALDLKLIILSLWITCCGKWETRHPSATLKRGGRVRTLARAHGLLLCLALTGLTSHAAAQNRDPVPPPLALRPGDFLRIRVWPDSTLGGEFPVEETGLVHLPVLGGVRAAEIPLEQLRRELRTRYGEALKNPVITVTPLFRVSVLGAVQRPGLYRVDPTQSLFDVISLAGGLRENAKAQDLRVIRDGSVLEINAKRALETGEAALGLSLRSGDRIVVPERGPSIFTPQNIYFMLQSVVLLLTIRELTRG